MELKIVINIKDSRAVVGVSSPDTDPVFQMVEGTLPEILNATQGIVVTAQEKWKTSPRNPKIEMPASAATPPTSSSTGSKAKPVPPASKPVNNAQPSMF